MGSRRSSIAWLCAAAALLLAYLPFFKGLLDVSVKNPYAGHVVFVPGCAAVLLWLQRHELQRVAGGGEGRFAGAGLTGAALVLLAFAYSTGSISLQALSLVAATAGLGLWLFGRGGLRRIRFQLLFLLLMVPPPPDVVSAVSPTIQHFVSTFSRVVLDSLNIPVEQHGILLRLPDLTLIVAEECAGLRFLPILFVFSAAFARVVLVTVSAQLAVMILAVPIAVLANAMRVAATGVGVYVIGPSAATGPLHYYIGKGFWVLALLTMAGLALTLRSRTIRVVNGGRSRPVTVETQ